MDAPATRSPRALLRALPSLILLLPEIPERFGVRIEDEALRFPLLLVVLAAALFVGHGLKSRSPRVVIPLLLALATGLALVLHPANPRGTLGAPFAFLALVGGMLLAPSLGRGREPRADLEGGLALAGVLAAAWVVFDALRGLPPVGPLGRPGVAGPTLAALLPFAARFGMRLVGRMLALRVAPAALVLAALVLSHSRTGLVAGLLGLSVALALSAPAPWKRRLLGFAASAALLFVALLGLSLADALPGGSWIGRTDTVRVRVGLAKASAALIAERPLAGHGPHGFSGEVLRVRDPDEARISAGRRPLAAHDDYLHAAVEGGLLAALALLALVVTSIVRALRAGDAVVAGALLAIGVSALAENPFLASFTACLFGILAVRAEGSDARPIGTWWVRGAAFALLVVAGFHGRAMFLDPVLQIYEGSFRADETRRAMAYESTAWRARWRRGAATWHDEHGFEGILDHDPGATEVRLDLAELDRLAGDAMGARLRLEEARRLDPTRFDVPLRLGHLLLGEEPAPSRATPPPGALAILRLYNEAEALDPSRFESHVARARVYRRKGQLVPATQEIDDAKRRAGLVGETLVEAFRIAEAQRVSVTASVGILGLALSASPTLAPEIAAEARRFLAVGEDEEKEAIEKAHATFRPDLSAAKLDFDAAARRIAALVLSGTADRKAILDTARAESAEGRHRRALASYRALFIDDYSANDPDLAIEAKKVASRVDKDLAAQWGARGRTLYGYEALDKGDLDAAHRDFKAAVSMDEGSAAAKYGLARVLARLGRPEEARPLLAEAIALDPSALDHAKGEPDLAGVLPAK